VRALGLPRLLLACMVLHLRQSDSMFSIMSDD
jgi:hypothetical protein